MHSACGTDFPCGESILRPKDFIRSMKPEKRTRESVQQRNLGLFQLRQVSSATCEFNASKI